MNIFTARVKEKKLSICIPWPHSVNISQRLLDAHRCILAMLELPFPPVCFIILIIG